MWYSGGIHAFVRAFYPAWWVFLYEAPLGFLIAYQIARGQAGEDTPVSAVRMVALIAGVGGAFTFLVMMGLGATVMGLLLALAAIWVGTSFAIDKYFDVDWETSQRITSLICVPVWLVWLIIGAVLSIYV